MRCKTFSRPMLALLALVALLITVTGLIFKQSFINILPLYISLFVALLQSGVNRTAYLIGALNSLLYAVVYVHFKLYASAVYAVLFSCTIQLATYFRWSRRPRGQATVFRALSARGRLGLLAGFALAWAGAWFILSGTDSGYRILDISTSLLGILVALLTMLAYIEYVPLMIFSLLVNIALYIAMMREHPAQITYLIYALFSLTCQFRALKKVVRLYRGQSASLKASKETE